MASVAYAKVVVFTCAVALDAFPKDTVIPIGHIGSVIGRKEILSKPSRPTRLRYYKGSYVDLAMIPLLRATRLMHCNKSTVPLTGAHVIRTI